MDRIKRFFSRKKKNSPPEAAPVPVTHGGKPAFVDVVRLGKLYDPATSHHENNPFGLSVDGVICDNCQKFPLDKCWGYNEMDLCMDCYTKVKTTLELLGQPL